MVELVFNAIHGERFQSCETQIFKNIDGKIKFLLKFPMRNCFKVLSMQPRMTGLLTSWLLGLISILLKIPTAIKWDYNSADNWHFVIAAKKPNTVKSWPD